MVKTRSCGTPSPPPSASRYRIGNRVSAVGKTRKTTRDQTHASLEKSPSLKLKARVQRLKQPIIDKHVEELRYSLFKSVALDGEQMRIWLEFLATDETVKVCDGFRVRSSKKTGEKYGEDVDPDVGIVRSLAKFAVDTFNKSYKLHVDGNTDAAMALTKCVGCYYYKLPDNYYFYMKLEATEKDEHGVYEVVVRCDCADGARTLTLFCFDSEEFEKRVLALYPPTESDTEEDVPSPESDTKEDVPSPESDTKEDVPRNRKDFYEASGMVRRRFINGHDFYNPLCKDRFICFDGAKPEKMMM